MAGIDPSQFTITVGNTVINPPANPNDSQIIASAYSAGMYWLVLRAPMSPGCSLCDLRIEYASYSDTEEDAIAYGPQPDVDNLLVIDRSGSMAGNKIDAAKDAARLYVDSYSTGDRIGVTSYNDAPKNEFSLKSWTNNNRDLALEAIANLDPPGGATAIGAALQDGMDRLAGQVTPNPAWAMVLLSDGKDTVKDTGLHIPAFLEAFAARKKKGDQVPVIHAVAIGDDADGLGLEAVTTASNGAFHWLPESGAAQAADAEAVNASIFRLDLAEIYRVVAERVADEQQIYASQGFLNNAATKVHTVKVDGGASQAIFTLAHFYTGIGVQFQVEVRRPDNSLLGPPTLVDDNHYLWRTPAPMAGDWKVIVKPGIPGRSAAGTTATDADRTDFLVEAALVSDLTMDVFLGLSTSERVVGKPMPILALLSDVKGITGATVVATIARTGEVVILHDDGQHGDGAANDGLYGGLFKQTHESGGYTAIVDGSGVSQLNGAFKRRSRVSFFIAPAKDSDNDKMPDWWEGPCMDSTVPDGQEDPDKDSLNNAAELANQTDPCDPDTDDGGESDGSEVARSQDPLLPSDDFGHPPTLNAWPLVGQVVVRLATADDSPVLTVYRGATPDGPWTIVNPRVDGNAWTDTRVENETQYCYRATATGRATSGPSAPVCATPKLDPYPPHGIVDLPLNTPQPVTLTTTIRLDGEDDPFTEDNPVYNGALLDLEAEQSGVVEMQISNRSDFADVVWQSYQAQKQWTFVPDVNGRAVVYARFKDGAGNISDTAALSVRIGADPTPKFEIFVPAVER